jgi:hypothetical protein
MATEPLINCPKCGAEIAVTEALAGPIVKRLEAETKKKLDLQADALKKREQALAAGEAAVEQTVRQRLAAESQRVEAGLRAEISGELGASYEKSKKLAEDALAAERRRAEGREAELRGLTAKLAEAQEAQAGAERARRDFEEKTRELNLTVERRVTEEADRLRSRLTEEITGAERTKLAEKQHTIDQMASQIEDLKKRAEQGSQQLQGEAQELVLESDLRLAFPTDEVEPVGKGVHGADCVQRVVTVAGAAGRILWESKRTKNWGPDWLAKLRDDWRSSGADVAVIVSQALPEGVATFALVEGVWVCAPAYAVPLAAALRQAITGIAKARAAQAGQRTKAELVYAYLTGDGFRHRIEAIVERFGGLREDLEKEEKFMTKQFAKRRETLAQAVTSLGGLYGDLEGIAGAAVAELPALSLGTGEES